MLAAEAPKITDWMQAWGSVIGLVLSGLAATATWLLFRHEIRVRREEQRDNEAAQARLIVPVLNDLPPDMSSAIDGGVHGFTIANYSDVPCYDIRIVLLDDGWIIGEYSPDLHVLMGEFRGSFSYLHVGEGRGERAVVTGKPAIGTYFTDASGLRWSKLNREPPIRVQSDNRWTGRTLRERQRAAARARLEKEMALRAAAHRHSSRLFRLSILIAAVLVAAAFLALAAYR